MLEKLITGFAAFALACSPALGKSLDESDISRALNSHLVFICDFADPRMSLQVQFVGPPGDWVAWLMRDGKAERSLRISNTSIIGLEGMDMLTDVRSALESTHFLRMTIDAKGFGKGTIESASAKFDLPACRSKI